jgi:hypothetical protein
MKHFRQILERLLLGTWEHGNDPKKVLYNSKMVPYAQFAEFSKVT